MKSDVTETDRFVFFWGGWPSQWFKCRFNVDGVTYNCCEQFMMAEKARVFEDRESLDEILAATNPRNQKAIGRRVRGFDDAVWNRVCRGIWGIGLAANDTRAHDPSTWRGTNWLGIAVTQVRRTLQREQDGAPLELDAELQSQLHARRTLP